MKYFIFVLFFLSLLTQGKSQRDFSLSDTTFEIGESINCECIYFDFDKATLKLESALFLDSMVTFLNANPSIQLEIQNHSDTRAKVTYSTNLSKRRAMEVVDYFTSKGIMPSRLVAAGYSNVEPLISEVEIKSMKSKTDQEIAHHKNRRTVFVIKRI